MGGHPDYFRGVCTGDGVRGRGNVTSSVLEADGSRCPADDHIKINFGGGNGAAAMGIMQVWRERGASEHGERQVSQAKGKDVGYGRRSGERRTPCNDRGFVMLGLRWWTPRWADDPVRRIDGRQLKGTRGRIPTPPKK